MKVLLAISAILASVKAMSEIVTQPYLELDPTASSTDTNNGVYILNSGARGGYLHNYGGATMQGVVPIYLLYYGDNFASNGTQFVQRGHIENVLSRISYSQWFNVARSFADFGVAYFDPKNSIQVSAYKGTIIDDGMVQQIITEKFSNGNANGIYVFVSDGTVSENFGSYVYGENYCGYHWYFQDSASITRKYAFVGSNNPRCRTPYLKIGTTKLYPAQGGDTDTVIAGILHELSETMTDPTFDSWIDPNTGNENADQCAWVYSIAQAVPGQSDKVYNFKSGSEYYLIQQNFFQEVQDDEDKGILTVGCPRTIYQS